MYQHPERGEGISGSEEWTVGGKARHLTHVYGLPDVDS